MHKPTCKRCGGRHFNFLKCDEAPVFEQQQEEKAAERERRKVVPIWQPDEAEYRPAANTWGNTDFSRDN